MADGLFTFESELSLKRKKKVRQAKRTVRVTVGMAESERRFSED